MAARTGSFFFLFFSLALALSKLVLVLVRLGEQFVVVVVVFFLYFDFDARLERGQRVIRDLNFIQIDCTSTPSAERGE